MASTPSQALETEVIKLFELVRKMRGELAQVSHPKSEVHALDTVADQLQTISIESQQTSETIRGACAKLKETGEKLLSEIKYTGARPILQTIVDDSEEIAAACQFHDVLAQRIARIVSIVNMVEGTLNSLVVTIGEDSFQGLPTAIAELHKDEPPEPF